MRALLLAAVLIALAGCSSSKSRVEVETFEAPANWPSPVGQVRLNRASGGAEAELLDVGIVVFDAGIPADPATHTKLGVFPRIRKAEAEYLPALVRNTLLQSNAWGVVRVLPKAEESSELLVFGTILHSDGLRLALRFKAVDATGKVWLQRTYVDESSGGDYPVRGDGDPYLDLYRQLANDLLMVRRAMSREQLNTIRNVGLLRYAASLSPDAFAGFLDTSSKDGQFGLNRLPADGDPMMARVQRIRNQEYLFIDTVDQQYAELYEEMGPTYHLWRQEGRELALFKEEYQRRVAARDTDGRRGSFLALEQTYNAFKQTKIQEQDLEEVAGGFNNEVAPTVMEAQGKVFKLSGTLDSQYTEWRDILREIFALETGLPPAR